MLLLLATLYFVVANLRLRVGFLDIGRLLLGTGLNEMNGNPMSISSLN